MSKGMEGNQINDSTAETPEPIVASGGTGVTSFDELEALQDYSPAPKQDGKAGEKSLQDLASKAGKKAAKPQGKDGGKEDEEHDESQEADEEAGQEEGGKEGQEVKAKDQKDQASKAVKSFKVKSGDKDVDLRGDAALDVTVSGKQEKVTVQDLVNNYAGKVSWERKFSQLDTERKTFQTERQDLQKSIDDLYDLAVKQSNPRAAIEKLAEAMGGDGRKIFQQLREEIKKSLDSYKDLSPEEIQVLEKDEELEYLRKKDETRASAEQQQKIEAAVGQRVKAIQEKFNLTEEGFYRAYDDLKKTGRVAPQDITPELVGQHHVEMKSKQELQQMIAEINPDLENAAQAVADLHDAMTKNDLSVADMKEIAAELYGSKKARSLVKKMKQAQGGNVNTARPSPARRTDPINFDDLE